MITYLSGAINPHVLESDRMDIGVMVQPRMGNRPASYRHKKIGVDNGCFSSADPCDEVAYPRWLEQFKDYGFLSNVLFATAPDVVGDAEATLARSLPHLPMIRRLGFPAAFVAQDGATIDTVPWDLFDVLFIGGTTEWKLSDAAWVLVHEAQRLGKVVHVGRVNSRKRLRLAAQHGVDSVDGTYLAFGPDVNWPRLTGWMDEANGVEMGGEEAA